MPSSREGELLVGKYRLVKRLGAGGMGEVYRAHNELIGRDVAIKVMRAEHARNEDIVERFMREARAANLVRHANVVDVVDVGKDDEGVPFIVQELLEGRDLASLLDRRGGLPHDEIIPVLLPVIEAIGLAHTRGVVHRDIKPDNVFLSETPTGVVAKILDFGISKIDAPDARRVTATGVSMGTPAYMSPEQIQGASAVDARSDVWSLGVLLHEVLTGALPFKGDTYGALFVQICTADPIPLASVVPDVPPPLARVVARCLRRDINERYASAAELARDLKHIAEGQAIEPTRKLAAVSVDARTYAAIDNVKPAVRSSDAPTLADLPGDKKYSTTVPERAAPRVTTNPDSGIVAAVESSPPEAPRSRVAMIAVAAIAVLGLAGGAVALRGSGSGSNTTAQPSATAGSSQQSAAPTAAQPTATQLPSIEPQAASAAPRATATAASAEPSAPATASVEPALSAAPSARSTGRPPRGGDPHGLPSARASAGAHAPTAAPAPSATATATAAPAHTAAPPTPTAAPQPTSSGGRPIRGTDQYE